MCAEGKLSMRMVRTFCCARIRRMKLITTDFPRVVRDWAQRNRYCPVLTSSVRRLLFTWTKPIVLSPKIFPIVLVKRLLCSWRRNKVKVVRWMSALATPMSIWTKIVLWIVQFCYVTGCVVHSVKHNLHTTLTLLHPSGCHLQYKYYFMIENSSER